MKRSLLGIALVLGVAAATASAAEPATARTGLTKPQLAVLNDEVIPAHRQESPAALLESLGPFVAKLSDKHMAAADEYLAEQKVPPIAELLAGARVTLVEQSQTAGLALPKNRELVVTLKGLKERIDQLLALCSGHEAFDDKAVAPANFAEFEKRLWEMHVLENRLAAGSRMARYALKLVEEARRTNSRRLSDEDRQIVETDFDRHLSELAILNRELSERTIEQRVNRLIYADRVLSESKDLKEKFQAAFVVDLDGELLAAFFKRLHKGALADRRVANPTVSTKTGNDNDREAAEGEASDDEQSQTATATSVVFRKSLADPQLPSRIDQLREHGRQSAGDDFLKKSRLLYTGLHWWYRGRYGAGSEGNGLLKSKLALSSPQAMFGLYMPKETPKPTDPALLGQQSSAGPQSQAVPQVDRRHHYLWQFETRQISSSSDSSEKTQKTIGPAKVVSVTSFDRFY